MPIIQSKARSLNTVKFVIKLFIPREIQNLFARWNGNRVHRGYAGLSLSDTFDRIYNSNVWGGVNCSALSSGPGSAGRYAEEYYTIMKGLLTRYDIQSASDLGCGDFNTGRLISTLVASYTGVDIAQQVIDANTRAYASDHVRFVRADITHDVLPPAGVAIVRQVFQHLSNSEVHAALDNVLRTYPLAFVTEHIYVGRNARPNLDISHGPGTRVQIRSGISIEQPPFNTNATPVGDIAVAPNEVLRTWAVKGNGKRP